MLAKVVTIRNNIIDVPHLWIWQQLNSPYSCNWFMLSQHYSWW